MVSMRCASSLAILLSLPLIWTPGWINPFREGMIGSKIGSTVPLSLSIWEMLFFMLHAVEEHLCCLARWCEKRGTKCKEQWWMMDYGCTPPNVQTSLIIVIIITEGQRFLRSISMYPCKWGTGNEDKAVLLLRWFCRIAREKVVRCPLLVAGCSLLVVLVLYLLFVDYWSQQRWLLS